jgi:5-aminolevulinate synthase
LLRRRLPVIINNSHIVPVLVRDPVKCKALTDALLQKHKIYLQPINYPTVAKGQERVRITPGPLHSEADLLELADALDVEWDALGLPREGELAEATQAACPHWSEAAKLGISY